MPNQFMTKAKNELMVERAFRAALSQMGSHVACAKGPISGKNTRSWVIEHTLSLSWRIGRAVALSRSRNQIDTVAESIIGEVGGSEAAKVLFKGKIVGVERTLRMGHVYGEVVIQGMGLKGEAEGEFKGRLKIPFKNENIVAIQEEEDGSETVRPFPKHTYPLFPFISPFADNLHSCANLNPADPRLSPRPHQRPRRPERRSDRNTRVQVRPPRHRPRHRGFRKMDLDSEGAGDRRSEGFWDG